MKQIVTAFESVNEHFILKFKMDCFIIINILFFVNIYSITVLLEQRKRILLQNRGVRCYWTGLNLTGNFL